MSQNPISNSLLNMALVLIESAMTLILKFDPTLRRAAYPLAKNNVVVCIRTYLPHTQFYATFTNKGVLLDSELPAGHKEVDVIINAYSHQLLNALISNDSVQVSKLTMRGAPEVVFEVRHFFVQLGLVSLFQGIIKTIKGKHKEDTSKDNADFADKPDYKAKIAEQQQQLNALSIRNRELELTVKESKSKQKTMLIALAVASLIAVIAIIGWMA